jgi:hypothetical protein
MEKTPRPETAHPAPETFVKVFDDDYLLSRELQILTDLGQRGAPVPRVLSTDHQARTITMTHAGPSLSEVIQALPSRRGERIAWLQHQGAAVFDAITAVCNHGVFHLDLACRNILLSANGPVLIDFGLALCQRFPLQKPLWVSPSPSLHHPVLITALTSDWQAFFADSPALRADYLARQRPYPPRLDEAFVLPIGLYSAYWPSRLQANEIAEPLALAAYSAGHLLEEFADQLALDGPEGLTLENLSRLLRSTTDPRQAQERMAIARAGLTRLGATPRPGHQTHAERRQPVQPRRIAGWPPSEGIHWLLRAGSGLTAVSAYFMLDRVYLQTKATLGDGTFIAALVVAVVGLATLVSLALARGLMAQRALGLALTALCLPFVYELSAQGAGPLQVGLPLALLVIALAVLVALPLAPRTTPSSAEQPKA